MFKISDFQGMQYSRDGASIGKKDYEFFNQQYATSSYQKEHDMFPSLIVQPKADEDIIKAVQWAKNNKVAVAVKSGGHQYSGASSTGGKNIQIDLSNTYKDMMVMEATGVPEDRALVWVGVSNRLQDFIDYLKANGLFVPTGQCAYVCAGGHGQTGGYGQLGRSFGLFGDNITSIRLVDHNGAIQNVTKKSDSELFYAITGGSPGNFGIITHYTIEAYRGSSYLGTVAGPNGFKGPHATKGLFIYEPKILSRLLGFLAKMADEGTAPRNYDLCVSVLSTDFPVTMLFPALKDDTVWKKIQAKIKSALAQDVLDVLGGSFPAVIVLYAQWCPTSKSDKYDSTVDNWFKQFRDVQNDWKDHTLRLEEFDADMSEMTSKWIFPKRREFDLPYVKRTYGTKSQTLQKDGWVNAVVGQLDKIYNPHQKIDDDKSHKEGEVYDHCKLSVQIQYFGGQNSRFYLNKDNGTSYSWRDSTIVQTLDCFHDAGAQYKEYAQNWQKENDSIMIGPKSPFSKQDRRVLWGSWGNWDMSKPEVWQAYYEDAEKYKRLGKARGKADPNGTFTPNPFAVTAVNDGSKL
ncbi:hypothetical protein FSARC_9483 [Fusarium sarcochroum]|uniref:FAD-binding PCMH-type domain-containing protein n=1 Tax=Fusarium sarcochroum TaxID=1208366 RepID=A0A8H4TRA8_9HYPO|nr:hypothetical protein FSARC_9483 [Fusarium sarcochroum]